MINIDNACNHSHVTFLLVKMKKEIDSKAMSATESTEEHVLDGSSFAEDKQTKTASSQTQETPGMSAPIDIPITQNLNPEVNDSVEKIYPTLDFLPTFLTTASVSTSTEASTNPVIADIPSFPPPTYEEHMQRKAGFSNMENQSSTSRIELFPAPSAPLEAESDAQDASLPTYDERMQGSTLDLVTQTNSSAIKQSTAIIFDTVSLPSNEAQMQKTNEDTSETEEEKRVRLAFASLASMPELPRAQLRIFDRENSRTISRSKEQQRTRQMPLNA